MMKINILYSCFLAPAFVFGADPFSVTSTSDSTIDSSESVSYSCTFENQWSASNHPNQYPSNAHWSPPVLATHGTSYSMWEQGGMASAGVELVAETGDESTLVNEIESSSPTVNYVVGEATFNNEQQSQTFDPITMTSTNQYLSTITMIAPSPDWLTGFYGFSATNSMTQTWYSSFVIDTYPWDAGTEDGDTYSGENNPTDPQESIFRFDTDTVPSTTGVRLNRNGDQVLPVATWTCTLLDDRASDESQCFSSSALASVKGKGNVPMSHVEVGDEVLTGTGDFEVVYSIDHRDPAKYTSFLQIYYSENIVEQHGEQKYHHIELTKRHLIYVANEANPVPASTIKVGDVIQTTYGPRPVTKISTVDKRGVFNPLTASGTIVVNGVVSSTYSAFLGTNSSNKLIGIVGYEKKALLSYQDFFTALLKPYMLLCTKVSPDMCKLSKNNKRVLIGDYAIRIFFASNSVVYKTLVLVIAAIFAIILSMHKVLAMLLIGTVIGWTILTKNDIKKKSHSLM